MKTHLLQYKAVSHRGVLRENNEDNLYAGGRYMSEDDRENFFSISGRTRKPRLFAVFDGLGGADMGEWASLTAARKLSAHAKTIEGGTCHSTASKIDDFIRTANAAVCDRMCRTRQRIGTTCAVLSLGNGYATAVNIGDSRIYLFRDNTLTQISNDHVIFPPATDDGLTGQEAAGAARRVLTQHIGQFPEDAALSPHVEEIPELKKNDVFLLCSDGLTDMVPDSAISRTLAGEPSVEGCADALLEKALAAGGKDNVTIIAIKIS